MLYHSMLTQVLTCATSFHQLYSMMKLAAVGTAQPKNANTTNIRMKARIWEGRIRAIFELQQQRRSEVNRQISRGTASL